MKTGPVESANTANVSSINDNTIMIMRYDQYIATQFSWKLKKTLLLDITK